MISYKNGLCHVEPPSYPNPQTPVATLAKDEADEARARGSSCAKLAAQSATVKVEKKNLAATIASAAATKVRDAQRPCFTNTRYPA